MPKLFSPKGRYLLGALLSACALLVLFGTILPYYGTLAPPPQNWGQTVGLVLHMIATALLLALGAYFVYSRVGYADFLRVGEQELEIERRVVEQVQQNRPHAIERRSRRRVVP